MSTSAGEISHTMDNAPTQPDSAPLQTGSAPTQADAAPPQAGSAPTQTKVRLAVYDFDGTCITGNSPVLLVLHLMRDGLLSFKQGFDIGLWALRYKFRLPQNESSVRKKVFRPFEGKPAADVDEYLRLFYDEIVAGRWRQAAIESMKARAAEGCYVMVVSASWQAIIDRACESKPFARGFATKMITDRNGCYTRQVDGLPVEGEEKLRVIERFANAEFGAGNWELSYAYGDHHSDGPLLAAAKQAFAVTPDKPLRRYARTNNWAILEW